MSGEPLPDRRAMLEWARWCAPDLRIRRDQVIRIDDDGAEVRGAICLFTLQGRRWEGFAEDPGSADKIAEMIYRFVRKQLGRPIEQARRSRDLEQQIVAAAKAGKAEIADALTQELVALNEGLPHVVREKAYEPIAPARPRPPGIPPDPHRIPPPPSANRW